MGGAMKTFEHHLVVAMAAMDVPPAIVAELFYRAQFSQLTEKAAETAKDHLKAAAQGKRTARHEFQMRAAEERKRQSSMQGNNAVVAVYDGVKPLLPHGNGHGDGEL
jgi:hypothetical protein